MRCKRRYPASMMGLALAAWLAAGPAAGAGSHDGVDFRDAAGCLECHRPGVDFPGGHHPIDVAFPRGMDAGGLPLQAGRMTCLTCHDLTAAPPGRLRLPMAESRLCRACHQQ